MYERPPGPFTYTRLVLDTDLQLFFGAHASLGPSVDVVV